MSRSADHYSALVVGGGFYGCSLAIQLKEAAGGAVLLVEREDQLMTRASYANQARIHNGYHYPRSLLTALRSHANYQRFLRRYADAADESFEMVYAIARRGSNVSAGQYARFCDRIKAPIEPAPERLARLFSKDLIEQAFLVREAAFDSVRLCNRLRSELDDAGVEVRLDTEATRILPGSPPSIELLEAGREARQVTADHIVNCTYSNLNAVLSRSNLPNIALKHEMAELSLIEPPSELQDVGITVMCGPFFSVMPFPGRALHSFSHVRYTPHFEWHEGPDTPTDPPDSVAAGYDKKSNFPHMIRDAQRYLPCLKRARFRESLWEIKTVLPRNEVDDGRPILFARGWGIPELTCVMGAKIDNIFDCVFDLSEETV